jgi:serine/threonine protein kinase
LQGRPIDAGLPLPQDVQVVLTDFGVARLMDATESPDMIVGTPAYMSPEQAAGPDWMPGPTSIRWE